MYSKFIAALALTAASTLALAAPSYEVVIKGAEPIRVTLNEAGESTLESTQTVLGMPAIVLSIATVNAQENEFEITLDAREGVDKRASAQGILAPALHQWSYRNRIKLSPAQTFKANDVLMESGESALSITRLD